MGIFFFLIIYVLHFLVSLMGDEGKDDSSNESLKIPTSVPENPGKLEPLHFYHRYPLSRWENSLFKEDCEKIQLPTGCTES